MNERQPISPQDVGNELLDALGAIWRWLVLVAAIAVGTCLGITLFVLLVIKQIGDAMPDVNFGPNATTTSTWSPR